METYEQLLVEIDHITQEIGRIKDRAKRESYQKNWLMSKCEPLSRELDILMGIKIQHELLSYLSSGGLPIAKYYPSKNTYSISIPGHRTIAYVNPQGLSLIKQHCIEHGNQEAASLLCCENEKKTYPFRT